METMSDSWSGTLNESTDIDVEEIDSTPETEDDDCFLSDEVVQVPSKGDNPGTSIERAEEIIKRNLEEFKSILTDQQVEQIGKTKLEHAKYEIFTIQKDQERLKSMMNLSRIRHFLDAFTPFNEACQGLGVMRAGVGEPDLSAFVWGPCRLILKVSANTKA
jgi:hypothetical protein